MFRRLLLLLVLFVPGVAHAEWTEASSAHFVVYADDSPERLTKFVNDLERFDQAMRALRGLPNQPIDKANRVTIYMLASTDAVGRLIGSSMVAGFYTGRAGGSSAFVPRRTDESDGSLNAQTVLFHEYSHHMMRSLFAHSAFPAWLVEGWAEFHATAVIKRDGGVLFGSAPAFRARSLLTQRPMPIDRMLSGSNERLTAEQLDGFYGRSWALTHFLTFEPGRQGQLSRYIAEINTGTPALQAAMLAFGDLKALDRDLDAFLNDTRITGITVGAARITIGEATLRTLTRGEAAMMSVRVRSKRGVNEITAPGVYADAQRIAAPWPNDPGVQIALAEAAFDAKDFAAAEAAADRAIAARPDAIEARIYKAMARMAIVGAAHDTKPESWRAVRALIVTANKLDPDHPIPLILYYQSFFEAGQTPNEAAKDGLFRAFELAPYDNELRLNLAHMLIAERKPDDARIVLRPLAYDPHGGGLATLARGMIERIDAEARGDRSGPQLAPAPPRRGPAPAPSPAPTPATP